MILRQMLFTFLFLSLLNVNSARAEIATGNCTEEQKAAAAISLSEHEAHINGKVIPYTVTVGFLEVTSVDKTAKACVFFTSYQAKLAIKPEKRPLTFAFNGGPGSASLWLHLGLMGPERVDMGSDGLTPPRTLGLIPNEDSLLDVTDIVLIDPVATGFSHTEGQTTNDKFFGIKNDYTSIGAFVQNYLDTYNRWLSPKFIMGESYGGIRGPLLTHYLQDHLNVGIAGLILISPALSDLTFFGKADNNIPYLTNLPSFATTAWYHSKISPKYKSLTVEEVYSKAKDFAWTTYRDALDQGNIISKSAFEDVAQNLSDFTGISKDKIAANDLKVNDSDIFSGLLENEKQTVGRYDSRFVGNQLSFEGTKWSDDPSGTLVGYPFVAAINDYLRNQLNFKFLSPYAVFADITSWPSESEGELFGTDTIVTPSLAQSLAANPQLSIFIASGYFDLACAMGGVEYEISRLPGRQQYSSRIQHLKYFGGHMMYINPVALKKLKSDLANFIQTQSN